MIGQISLVHLNIGDRARVANLLSTGPMRRRLQDLGIVEGTTVQCVQKSPSGDPTAYAVRGAVIALRKEDAQNVVVHEVVEKAASARRISSAVVC